LDEWRQAEGAEVMRVWRRPWDAVLDWLDQLLFDWELRRIRRSQSFFGTCPAPEAAGSNGARFAQS
jgi:hypothetical protein